MYIIGKRKIISSIILACIAGFLHALAFDPFNSPTLEQFSFVFSFLGITLWLGLVIKSTPKRALLLGYCFGLFSFGWGINWLYISLSSFGNASLFFSVFCNLAVVCYIAIYWLIASYLITKLSTSVNLRLLLAPFIALLMEWIKSWFILGFPWLNIAYAWIDTPLSQLAEYGGTVLVGLLAVTLSSLFLLRIKWFLKLILIVIYSLLVISLSFSPKLEKHNSLDIALIQGNTPVITKYVEPYMSNTFAQYLSLNEELLQTKKPIDLLVWPESAIPYFLNHFSSGMEAIYQQQKKQPFAFISGIPFYDEKSSKTYNAGVFQQADKTQILYKKVSLVPFGEYLPFRKFFYFFESFVQIPLSDFSSGEIQQRPFTIKNINMSMSMCFDIIFGESIRLNAQNTQLFINISNDSWFKQSKAQSQHLDIVRMRAIENRKPIIRSTSTGLTAHILPDGSIKKAISPYQKGILTDKVITNNYTSFYNRHGDKPWIILIALVILLLCVFNLFCINKKTN